MPAPRRRQLARNGYHDGHMMQCVTSHDFFDDAWGRLDKLTPDELATARAEMLDCYQQHRTEIDTMAAQAGRQPWIAENASDVEAITNA